MLEEKNDGRTISRRTILSGISGAVGTTALSGITLGKQDERQFVGKTYDPYTDKEQGDAFAVLNITSNELKGKLNAAGFDIPLGKANAIEEQNNHPRVDTYKFEKTTKKYIVTHNGKDLPLHGRIDVLDDRITGILTRPSSEYGKIAFSLLPSDQGFSSAHVARVLKPERRRNVVPKIDEITIPKTGIPTDNSIRNAPAKQKEEPSTNTLDSNTTSVSTSSTDKDVGFLDSQSDEGWISYAFNVDRCDNEYTSMEWSYSFGTSAEVRYDGSGNIDTDYDEITSNGGYKRFQLQSHFTQVPDPFAKSCDQDEGVPYQTGVEFWAHHTDGTTKSQASLSKPHPNSSDKTSDPGDGILDLALDIVGAAGGTYASIAATVINYALSSDSSSDITVVYDGDYNGNNSLEEYYWDLNLDGYESDSSGSNYFPDHADNVAGVSFKVENGAAECKTPQLETRSRFEWGYLDYIDGSCPCEVSNMAFKTTTTAIYNNYAEYKSVLESGDCSW